MKTLCLLAITLALVCLPKISQAQSIIPTNPPPTITLAWNASVPWTNGPLSYTLYYGPASATYTNSISAGTNLTATVNNLVRGATYFFTVTATATNGLVSLPSIEVSAIIPTPAPPPTVLRIITN